MVSYTKEKLQNYVTMTLSINNEFKENGFIDFNNHLLKITKEQLIECLDAHKYLYEVSQNEKSITFGIKLIILMLLRISSLYHNQRCENGIELQECLDRFNKKYNLEE